MLGRAGDAPQIAPADGRRKISAALIRDMAPKLEISCLAYQLLSYTHVSAYRKSLGTGRAKRSDLMAAYFFDVCWDGEAME